MPHPLTAFFILCGSGGDFDGTDFPSIQKSIRRLKMMHSHSGPQIRANFKFCPLTCCRFLVITIRSNRTGLGVCKFGRSKASRGRIPRERSAPFQAQGATGRHYQGGQAPLLLPEARREKARQGRARSQASSQENTQRTGLARQTNATKGRSFPGRLCLIWPPHHLELQPGFYTHHSSGIKSTIVCTHAPSWARGGPSPRATNRGSCSRPVFSVYHRSSFPAGGRPETG